MVYQEDVKPGTLQEASDGYSACDELRRQDALK
jgi:hypothetical protein